MARKILMDLEMTTNFSNPDDRKVLEIDRIYEVSLIEADENYNITGKAFTTLINPETEIKDPPPKKLGGKGFHHEVTNEDVADKPAFRDVAQEIRDFIGDSEVVVTCWTITPEGKPFCATLDNMIEPEGSLTLDFDFLNTELERAGVKTVPKEQCVNVKRLFEVVMGGVRESSLSKVVPHCGFSFDDFGTRHTALADAKMLAAVIPPMQEQFNKKKAEYKATKSFGDIKPGAQRDPSIKPS